MLELGTRALAAVSAEQLLALLIIKLKPVTSVDTSRSAILRCVRWPGRWLACWVGLLGRQCECIWFVGQDSMLSTTTMPYTTTAGRELMKQWSCTRVHVGSSAVLSSLQCSCNQWNRNQLNSLTWLYNTPVNRYFRAYGLQIIHFLHGSGAPYGFCHVLAVHNFFYMIHSPCPLCNQVSTSLDN